MRKNILLLSAIAACTLSLVILLATGCQKEVTGTLPGNPTTPVTPTTPPAIDQATVTASVRGMVVDDKNVPVQGATVTSGTQTTTTDRFGQFHFKNITLSKNNGYVKVSKAGYFHGSRSFFTTAGRTHTVRIAMIPKTTAGNFSAASGGTINLTGGAKLVMPAGAITDAGGTPYTGTVDVAMTWIDPTSSNLPYIMPGDLRGITTNGEERGLQTFGMMGVELTGAGGQPVKLAANKTAELSFPIPASLGSAPATIDLWHFDEVNGRWRQEGTATKNGNYYIANVKHFSFWNCDAPFPLVEICMTIVGPHSVPLNNVQVRIKRANGSFAYGRTDSAGNLCGKVPKDEALVLEVLDQCTNVVASQNIGPFSANANIGTITANIPASGQITITGAVQNCTGGNVTNGAVVVYVAGGNSYTTSVTNGNFSLTILTCATVNFSVLPIDYTTIQQGVTTSATGTTGTVNVGTLQACGTSAQVFLELLIDGIPENFVAPADLFSAMDSVATAPWQFKTDVRAERRTPGGNALYGVLFNFSNNQAPGTLPLNYCMVRTGIGVTQQIVTANPTINITAFGPPNTGFIEGNFAIQMDFAGTIRNVSCNFRIRR
jgi:hypothetical protein